MKGTNNMENNQFNNANETANVTNGYTKIDFYTTKKFMGSPILLVLAILYTVYALMVFLTTTVTSIKGGTNDAFFGGLIPLMQMALLVITTIALWLIWSAGRNVIQTSATGIGLLKVIALIMQILCWVGAGYLYLRVAISGGYRYQYNTDLYTMETTLLLFFVDLLLLAAGAIFFIFLDKVLKQFLIILKKGEAEWRFTKPASVFAFIAAAFHLIRLGVILSTWNTPLYNYTESFVNFNNPLFQTISLGILTIVYIFVGITCLMWKPKK